MKLKLPACNIGDVCLIACDPEHGSDFREFIIICILLCAEKQRASCFFSKVALRVWRTAVPWSSRYELETLLKVFGGGWARGVGQYVPDTLLCGEGQHLYIFAASEFSVQTKFFRQAVGKPVKCRLARGACRFTRSLRRTYPVIYYR